ncbi:hypothetical protein ILYODFUR_037897 [Ilyodon furcidens]|uniref:Uncharacterized protein n=1 Tax=Ilyodon furcidens TaxID=33524 RepID=A0ABV0TGZ8_9TELE
MLCYVYVCFLLCACYPVCVLPWKNSSYLQSWSFWSSSPHIGPSKKLIMTEETSQWDQVEGMVKEFKRGEILAKLFSHLVSWERSPGEKINAGNSWQPSRLARGEEGFFP